ncbi:MAG TPA: hypothetical protein VIF60_11540 [Burkholderiaceae bacterium]
MPHMTFKEDRLDAWFDGSAVCLIAIGAHNDPLDLSAEEVEALIAKLQGCLQEIKTASVKHDLDFRS